MSETARKHKSESPTNLIFSVFTVSTSRFAQLQRGEPVSDPSGSMIESKLIEAGHHVIFRRLISDDEAMIREGISHVLDSREINAAVFCGGTGIASSDLTIETVAPFLEKTLPGFGEIFRRLSYDEIGSPAVMSRAIAGVAKGKVIFCIPGSPNAVELCLKRLVLPEAGHIVKHASE